MTDSNVPFSAGPRSTEATSNDDKLITLQNVASAIEVVTAMGKEPTVFAIRKVLGGSNRDITECLRKLKVPGAANPAPYLNASAGTLAPGIIKSIEDQIAAVAESAAADASAKAMQLFHEKEQMLEALQASEELASLLQTRLDEKNAAIQQQIGQLKERSIELENVRQAASQSINEAEKKLTYERETAMVFSQDLAKANLKVDAMPGFESKIVELTSQLRESENALSDAKTLAAVADAQKEAQAIRADESVHREQLSLENVKALEGKLDKASQQTQALTATVRALEKDLFHARKRIALYEAVSNLKSKQPPEIHVCKEGTA